MADRTQRLMRLMQMLQPEKEGPQSEWEARLGALQSLVKQGKMQQATADSIMGGIKKYPTPSAKEAAGERLVASGLMTPAQMDSSIMGLKSTSAPSPLDSLRFERAKTGHEGDKQRLENLKLDYAKKIREMKEGSAGGKYGVTPWYLSPEWINTEVGKAAQKHYLSSKNTLDEDRKYLENLIEFNDNYLFDDEIGDWAKEQYRKVLSQFKGEKQSEKKKETPVYGPQKKKEPSDKKQIPWVE